MKIHKELSKLENNGDNIIEKKFKLDKIISSNINPFLFQLRKDIEKSLLKERSKNTNKRKITLVCDLVSAYNKIVKYIDDFSYKIKYNKIEEIDSKNCKEISKERVMNLLKELKNRFNTDDNDQKKMLSELCKKLNT